MERKKPKKSSGIMPQISHAVDWTSKTFPWRNEGCVYTSAVKSNRITFLGFGWFTAAYLQSHRIAIEKFLLCNYCPNGFMEKKKRGAKCFGSSLTCLRSGHKCILGKPLLFLATSIHSHGLSWSDSIFSATPTITPLLLQSMVFQN